MTEERHTGGGERDTSVGLVACETCTHPLAAHSREPGIGCLHGTDQPRYVMCPCLRAGSSAADQ